MDLTKYHSFHFIGIGGMGMRALAVILLGVGGYLLEMPFPAVAAVLGAVCAAGCALSYRSLLRTADRYYLRGV